MHILQVQFEISQFSNVDMQEYREYLYVHNKKRPKHTSKMKEYSSSREEMEFASFGSCIILLSPHLGLSELICNDELWSSTFLRSQANWNKSSDSSLQLECVYEWMTSFYCGSGIQDLSFLPDAFQCDEFTTLASCMHDKYANKIKVSFGSCFRDQYSIAFVNSDGSRWLFDHLNLKAWWQHLTLALWHCGWFVGLQFAFDAREIGGKCHDWLSQQIQRHCSLLGNGDAEWIAS